MTSIGRWSREEEQGGTSIGEMEQGVGASRDQYA